jgi:hypothetical protein
MSIDKFIMRGMTGSLGSGGDTWVAKATPPPQTTQPTHTHQASGTSFVMGGGGLGRPSNKPQSGREQGAEESWRSFDSRSIRENGGLGKLNPIELHTSLARLRMC